MKEELRIIKKNNEFPLSLELFKENLTIDLSNNIIFLAGDNGSGKSTILDMIAYMSNSLRIAHEQNYNSIDFKAFKGVQKYCSLSLKGYKNKYYFRSEDFITYINFLHKEKAYSLKELERINIEYKNKSKFALQQAQAPFSKTIYEIESMYNKDLLEQSHGQSYLDFFSSRLRENTLYILDEPEAALSFNSLLVFISFIKQYIDKGSKFIIATHSPVLLAMEEAVIYEITNNEIKKSSFDDLEQINLLKSFLKNPNSYLKHL